MACSASRSAARRLIYFCLTLSGRRSGKAATAPPVHMIKLTETRSITPNKWVHPDEER